MALAVESSLRQFLQGLSYRAEEDGPDHLFAVRSHAGRVVDRIYLRWCERDLSRDEWRQQVAAFRALKAKGHPGAKWFVYPAEFSFSPQRAKDADAAGFRPIEFGQFLDKFFGLQEVVNAGISLIRGRDPKERAEFEELLNTYTDQDVLVGDSPLDKKAKDFVLRDWFARPGAQVLVLLAPAGHGKTALTKTLAFQLLKEYRQANKSPVPILIPFGTYRKLVTYRALILEHFEDLRHPILMDAFNVMLDAGRIFLILDGFDELCEQVGASVARENLETIAGGLRAGGKALLTSRTTFFRTSVEGLAVITSVVQKEAVTVAELMPLDEDQQKELAVKLCDRDQNRAQAVLSIARKVTGSEGLAGSPFLLKQLVKARAGVNGADFTQATKSFPLYEVMLKEICKREIERQGYDTYRIGVREQLPFLEDVAEWVYEDTAPAEGLAKSDGLPTGTISFIAECNFEGLFRSLRDPERQKRELIDKLTHHALLTAPEQADRVQFIHHTWRDFLVARRLRRLMLEASGIERAARMLAQRPVPEWVTEFLASSLAEPELKTVAAQAPKFRGPGVFPRIINLILKFAELAEPTDKEARTALFISVLGGFTLRAKLLPQVKFSQLVLSEHSFDSSELRDAQFIDCTLQHSVFRNANLRNAIFRDCDLSGASFEKAILSGASFEDCDCEGADFRMAVGLEREVALALHESGATVGLSDLPQRSALTDRDLAKRLVIAVLEKFRDSATIVEQALERGVPPRFKPLIRNFIVPRLKTMGYMTEIRRPPKYIVKRNEDRNPTAWALVERGEESSDLRQLIDAVIPKIKRQK
jgi:hypothetical protein